MCLSGKGSRRIAHKKSRARIITLDLDLDVKQARTFSTEKAPREHVRHMFEIKHTDFCLRKTVVSGPLPSPRSKRSRPYDENDQKSTGGTYGQSLK